MPISRCEMDASTSSWRISIGSSMVTTWTFRVALMWWTIAASVVVFPEPVGPATSTRPRLSSAKRARAACRMWPAFAAGRTWTDRTPYTASMGSIGTPELLIVLVVVLVLFGGSKLPGLARSLGEAGREFRKGAAAEQKNDERGAPDS